MSNDLKDKLVILTGATGALARTIAPVLREAGARLALVGHGQDIDRYARTLKAEVALRADLTAHDEAASLRDLNAFALVHTVGGFAVQRAQQATEEDLHTMFSLNFDTLFHAVQAALPGMLERGSGRIIGVSAGQALQGSGAGAALYTASKAALAAYLKALDAELCPKGVRTSVLYPTGAFDTPANRASGLKAEAMISPHDLAEGVLYLLTRSARAHANELRVGPG